MDVKEVLADLVAEQADLDGVVAGLADTEWALPTPSPGWNVADQIGHLSYFDATAAQAISDPDGFRASVEHLFAALGAPESNTDDLTLGEFRSLKSGEQLERWRHNRFQLQTAAASLDNGTRVIWYGPSMGAKSFLTARLMECWAHGQDIVDAVGATRVATDRLRHIAQLGFITRGWSYKNRGLKAPDGEVRVELTAPSGATWTFGPETASESVAGSAEEFCLVVTQRRSVHATSLTASPIALDWLVRAQAFAGPASDPPS